MSTIESQRISALSERKVQVEQTKIDQSGIPRIEKYKFSPYSVDFLIHFYHSSLQEKMDLVKTEVVVPKIHGSNLSKPLDESQLNLGVTEFILSWHLRHNELKGYNLGLDKYSGMTVEEFEMFRYQIETPVTHYGDTQFYYQIRSGGQGEGFTGNGVIYVGNNFKAKLIWDREKGKTRIEKIWLPVSEKKVEDQDSYELVDCDFFRRKNKQPDELEKIRNMMISVSEENGRTINYYPFCLKAAYMAEFLDFFLKSDQKVKAAIIEEYQLLNSFSLGAIRNNPLAMDRLVATEVFRSTRLKRYLGIKAAQEDKRKASSRKTPESAEN